MPVKNIVTNLDKLKLVSTPCKYPQAVIPMVDDLLETALFEAKRGVGCVGLASNQIGTLKRIIVVFISGRWIVMINPVITPNPKAGRTSAKERCLSRPGVSTFRKRFKKIDVSYINYDLQNVSMKLSRLSARIVQHEVDHLDGIHI